MLHVVLAQGSTCYTDQQVCKVFGGIVNRNALSHSTQEIHAEFHILRHALIQAGKQSQDHTELQSAMLVQLHSMQQGVLSFPGKPVDTLSGSLQNLTFMSKLPVSLLCHEGITCPLKFNRGIIPSWQSPPAFSYLITKGRGRLP